MKHHLNFEWWGEISGELKWWSCVPDEISMYIANAPSSSNILFAGYVCTLSRFNNTLLPCDVHIWNLGRKRNAHTQKTFYANVPFSFIVLWYAEIFLNAVLMTWVHLSACLCTCVQKGNGWAKGSKTKNVLLIVDGPILLLRSLLRCVEHSIFCFCSGLNFIFSFPSIFCVRMGEKRKNKRNRRKPVKKEKASFICSTNGIEVNCTLTHTWGSERKSNKKKRRTNTERNLFLRTIIFSNISI